MVVVATDSSFFTPDTPDPVYLAREYDDEGEEEDEIYTHPLTDETSIAVLSVFTFTALNILLLYVSLV